MRAVLDKPGNTRTSKQVLERARRRRYEARVRRGVKVALVEYNASTLDFLIKLKWLTEEDASSTASVAQAIQALLKASSADA